MPEFCDSLLAKKEINTFKYIHFSDRLSIWLERKKSNEAYRVLDERGFINICFVYASHEQVHRV